MTNPARTFLYVPGDRPERVARALTSSADAVIVDLEDAVKPERKADARATVQSIEGLVWRYGIELWVRINSGDMGRADLILIGELTTLTGLVLAKCESTAWITEVAEAVGALVKLSPLVESAVALRDVHELAEHARTSRLQLGEIDLLADLGASPPASAVLLDHARCALVVASVAAGIEPPVGGVHLAVDDLVSLRESGAYLQSLGFGGRALIHPSHCDITNEVFSPTEADIAWAHDVLNRLASSTAGAVRDANGAMLDEAVVRRARRLIRPL